MPHIPDIDERLAAYVDDGSLQRTARRRSANSTASPELREQVESARSARAALAELELEDVPPGTLQPVVRELDRLAAGGTTDHEAGVAPIWSAGEPARSRTSRWSLVLVAAAAARSSC